MQFIQKLSLPMACGLLAFAAGLGTAANQAIGAETEDSGFIEEIVVTSRRRQESQQGVLFGKNTIAGNIVVNRVRPQFNELGGKVAVEIGNYSSSIVKARVNIPLIDDKLALKVGAIERSRDGFCDNVTLDDTAGDVDIGSQTVALRWAPTDAFDAILTYDRIRDRGQIPPQDPRFNGDDPFENLADKKEPVKYDVDQMGLRLQWDLNDRMVVSAITGWHDGHDLVNQDFDGGAISGAAIPFAQLHTLRANPGLGEVLCQFSNARSIQRAGEDVQSVAVFGKNLTDGEWREQALFLGGPNTGFQGWGAPRTDAFELMITM